MKTRSICVLLIIINLPLFAQIAEKIPDESDISFAFVKQHRLHPGLVYGLKPLEGSQHADVILNNIAFNKYRFHLKDQNNIYDLYYYEDHPTRDFISDLNSEIRKNSRAVIDLGFYKLNSMPFKETQYVILPEIDTFSITAYFKAIAERLYKDEQVYLAIIPVKTRGGKETSYYSRIADVIKPSSRLFYILLNDTSNAALAGFPDKEHLRIIKLNEPFAKPEPLRQVAMVNEPEPLSVMDIMHEDLRAKPVSGYYIKLHGDTTDLLEIQVNSIHSSRSGKRYPSVMINAKGILPLPIDPQCIPVGLNDRLEVNIAKPKGYNLAIMNKPDHPHNSSAETRIIVEAFGNEQIDLMVTRLSSFHIIYLDLSGTIHRQKTVSKIQEIIQYMNKGKDDYLIYTSNYNIPLIVERSDIESDPAIFNNYLRKLIELRPDPPSAADDRRRIASGLNLRDIALKHEKIVMHIFLSETYSGQYQSIIDNIIWQVNNRRDEIIVYHNKIKDFDASMSEFIKKKKSSMNIRIEILE
jgi:hypothetical protein